MKRFTIVVGVDFSDLSNEAVRVGINLARASGDADIHLVHVLLPPVANADVPVAVPLTDMENDARQRLEATLASAMAQTTGAPSLSLTSRLVLGSPRSLLPEIARDLHADLLVVGTHGRTGIARLAFGSVAESVTRHAPCSVLTVRARTITPEERIEAACPACEARARESAGASLLCEEHAKHHVHAHTYREVPESFGLGSLLIRPEA